MRLQAKGWLRRGRRSLSTPKGFVLALVGMAVFSPMLLWVFFMPRGVVALSSFARRIGPVMMLIFCVINLTTMGAAQRAINFTPAEVNLLFPAPLRQRHLLAYKLIVLGGVCLLTAPFVSALVLHFAGSLLAGLTGVVLGVLFLQFFITALGVALNAIGAMAYNRSRKAALVVVAVLVLAVVFPVAQKVRSLTFLQVVDQLEHAVLARILLAPFRPFVEAFAAERIWPDLVGWSAVALAIDAALVACIFAFDAQYLEASAAASAKLYERIERLRKTRGGAMLRMPKRAGRSLPLPPRLGGIGPMAWRQLSTARRDIVRLMIAFFVVAPIVVPILIVPSQGRDEMLGWWFSSTVFSTCMFLTAIVPFDFRADLDRMPELKALPVSPIALAIGQLVTPVLVLTSIQWMLLGALACARPVCGPVALGFALCAVPSNLVFLGLDNIVFLLFPIRTSAGNPMDFQALGSAILAMFGKLACVGLVGLGASAAGFLAFYLTAGSMLAVLAAVWVVLFGTGLALMPLLGWAFRRFDVTRDVPA
jgi:hypothetical protein